MLSKTIKGSIGFVEDFIFSIILPNKCLVSICLIFFAMGSFIFGMLLYFHLIQNENSPFLSKNKMIVVGDYNGLIQVYDENKTLLHTFTAHYKSKVSNCIEFLKYLPCGEGYVASVADDAWVNIWRISDWSLKTAYNGHSKEIYTAEYLYDDTIATASLDETIQIWSISTGILKRKINALSGVYSVKLLSDNHLASGHSDKMIRIWNYNTGKLVNTLEFHGSRILALRHINEDILASASGDYTIVLWNLKNNSKLITFKGHKGQIWILLYYSQLNMLISAAQDNTIKEWNLTSLSLIRTLNGHSDHIFSLAFFKNETLVSCATDQTLRFWHIPSGQLLDTIENGLSNQAVETIGF